MRRLPPTRWLPFAVLFVCLGAAVGAAVSESDQGRLVLALGVAASILLFGLLWTLATGKERVERLVERTTQTLRHSEGRMRSLTASSPVGIFHTDEHLQLTYMNTRWEEISGQPAEHALGDGWQEVLDPADRSAVLSAWNATAAGRAEFDRELRLRRPDGRVCWVQVRIATVADEDIAAGFVGSVQDITERKAFEAQLEHQALHDELTDLPNRTLFADRVAMALTRVERRPESLAVLFLDLDRFKVVNDSLGHAPGDELLHAVSRRLAGAVRAGDTVARFSGDQFVVLSESLSGAGEAIEIAGRLLISLADPFVLGGREVFITASIGIAFATETRDSPAALVRDADAAMYRAKDAGGGRHVLFDGAMRARAIERLALEGDLRHALQRDELFLVFQPQIDIRTGAMAGAEALLRWAHPERGVVAPLDFVPLAEETGLIGPIGAWVLQEACRQAARWQALRGNRDFRICVNLSVRQLGRADLVDTVRDVLAENGMPPQTLCLEITESVLMADGDACLGILAELKALGVRLAVDDFGTGYSSLSYLRRYPFDIVKVDRSFVRELEGARRHAAILESIVTMGHAVGMAIVAEGVETAGQLTAVRALGCDLVQGFYLSLPVAPDALEELLRKLPVPRPAVTA